MSRYTKIICSTLLVAITLLFYIKPGLANAVEDCNSTTPKKSLAGCSKLIKEGKLKGAELATAYILRSDAQLAFGKTNKAISDRQEAYKLAPKDAELKDWLTRALAVRGSQYIEKENLQGALADFRVLHKLQPKSPRVSNTLSELLSLKGVGEFETENIEQALTTFNEAISLNPLNAKLYVWRGDVLQKLNLKASAMNNYYKSIKLDPQQTLAFERRGRVFLKDGDHNKAIADFNKVLTSDPNNISILLLRAIASEPLTSNDQAYIDYKTVLKLNPKNKDAKAGLKRLKAKTAAQVKLVQIELQRLGCKPGSVDGNWGKNGKAALARYAEASGRKDAEKQDPGPILLTLLKSSQNNICAPPESAKSVSCFTFNGEKFCE